MCVFVISVFVMVVIQIASADQHLQCASWSNLERELIHKAHQVNCTISTDCTGISCFIHQYGYDIHGGISINPCENPPSVSLDVDVPKLNVRKWRKKFYHGDKFSLSETLSGTIEVKSEKDQYILGLLLDLPSGIKPNSPLLHLIPSLASGAQFHVFQNITVFIPSCSSPSTVPHTRLDHISTVKTTAFPMLSSEVQSNCSILNSSCTTNEVCLQISKSGPEGICVCITDYVRNKDGKCIHVSPEISTTETPGGHSQSGKTTSNTSLLLTAILVPLSVIVVAVGLVYATIRFRVFQHLRRRLRVQVYEHVLLGEEDEDDEESLNPVA